MMAGGLLAQERRDGAVEGAAAREGSRSRRSRSRCSSVTSVGEGGGGWVLVGEHNKALCENAILTHRGRIFFVGVPMLASWRQYVALRWGGAEAAILPAIDPGVARSMARWNAILLREGV